MFWLREVRENLGFSQAEVCKRFEELTGRTLYQQQYSRYENGERPQAQIAKGIADALGIPLKTFTTVYPRPVTQLRKARLAKGHTVEEAAEIIGISKQVLMRYDVGVHRMKYGKEARAIAEYVGTDLITTFSWVNAKCKKCNGYNVYADYIDGELVTKQCDHEEEMK